LIIGIAGAYSGAGKTTYASLLLRNLRGWGAIKYTKTALYCSIIDDYDILSREGKDTRRLMDSGAERVLWVRCPPSDMGKLLPLAVEKLSDLKGIVVEGNSAIEFLRPDIILFIFGSDPARIKETAKGVFRKADAIVAEEGALPEIQGETRRFGRSLDDSEPLIRYLQEMIDRKEKIKASLRESSVDGKISCSLARKIASDLSVPFGEVGKTANELKIKITGCELGCF